MALTIEAPSKWTFMLPHTFWCFLSWLFSMREFRLTLTLRLGICNKNTAIYTPVFLWEKIVLGGSLLVYGNSYKYKIYVIFFDDRDATSGVEKKIVSEGI